MKVVTGSLLGSVRDPRISIGVSHVPFQVDGRDGVFTFEDEEMFKTYATYAAVSLRNCKLFDDLQEEKEKNETMVKTLELLCGTPLQESHKVQNSVMKVCQHTGLQCLLGTALLAT